MVFRDDILTFPMANLHYQFNGGRVAGNTLIDISHGSFIHHLYSACNSFQDIVVLKFNEKCIMELSRWLHDRTGAYDWTHTSAAAAELEGNRDQHQEKESRLKSSIKQILKCDFEHENITSPVELPLADCVISAWILEPISKNEDEYMRNLEKILKLLKNGGHLLLISDDMVFRDDILTFPMANLHYQFNGGRVAGNTLIDISHGSFIHHLYSACNSFQDIVVLKFNEKCIMELSRWLHDRTGAYDWTHTSAAAAELEGNRDQHQEKESRLKSSIKQILKCDFEHENITSPVELPLADCVISAWILEPISKNEDEYMRNLEKILKLLKNGGHLLLISLVRILAVLITRKLQALAISELMILALLPRGCVDD
ncbi:uncharacterized protein ACMZJ9_006783 [Mantella aurantiaca]